jgi:hypothetical protein
LKREKTEQVNSGTGEQLIRNWRVLNLK